MSAAGPFDTDIRLVRPSWSRLHFCKIRDRWLLLVPERVLFPCPTTVELLARLGEEQTFGRIVTAFAADYDASADEIAADLSELLADLVEKGYVRAIQRA